jgi:hypothetical protein
MSASSFRRDSDPGSAVYVTSARTGIGTEADEFVVHVKRARLGVLEVVAAVGEIGDVVVVPQLGEIRTAGMHLGHESVQCSVVARRPCSRRV